MKNYKKEIYKEKSEWLKNRGIGGSDCIALFNLGKWTTINDLYNRLALKQFKKDTPNKRIQDGINSEPLVRKLFIIEHPEFKITEPPKKGYWLFRRRDDQFLTVSPDGLIDDDGFLELKDVALKSKQEINDWSNNIIPNQYLFQLLWYFVVLDNLKFGYLHCRFKVYKYNDKKLNLDYIKEVNYLIERSNYEKEIKVLKKKADEFIHQNVEPKKRPSTKISFKK